MQTSQTQTSAPADQPPAVLSPLQVVSDPNGVNLTDGKIQIDIPSLSVPAAPRLRFQRVQDLAPYSVIKYGSGDPDFQSINISFHTGTGGSESFHCVGVGGTCTSVTGTGSTTTPAGQILHEAGSYAAWNFNLLHVKHTLVSPVNPTSQYYASSVSYPDGETISYSYDTAMLAGDIYKRTFYRPNNVSSSLGYAISITYQSSDFNDPSWGSPSVVTLYKTSDPTTPLGRLTYSLDGTTITDLGGRVYHCTICTNAVGSSDETYSGSTQLPGESGNAKQVTAASGGNVVGSVTRDGVVWNYAYTNLAFSSLVGDYAYSKINVTGPNGYNVNYDVAQQGNVTTGQRNVVTKATDPLGRATSYSYDGAYRLIRRVAPEGNEIDITYDDYANIINKTTKAKPGSGLADLVETAFVDESTCTGVLCYRPSWTKDALNRQTDYVYDANGMLTQQTDPADANGVRRVTYITYTTAAPYRKSVVRICGNTTTCGTSAELRTEYDYWDSTSLPSAVRRFDGSTYIQTTYSYDNAGRLLSEDGPLAGTDDASFYRYDVYGRKTWEIGPKDENGYLQAKRYTYRDSDSKPTMIETGNVTSELSNTLNVFNHMDTTYDSRRYPIRAALSGVVTPITTYNVADKSFDDRGQLICSTVRMNMSSLPTDACTLGTAGSFGSDRVTKNVYDNAGQLVQVRKAVGTGLEEAYATYSYTANGKQEYLLDANGNRAKFEYDGFDRQVKWIFPSTTRPPAYNPSTQANALATAGALNTADYEQYGYDAVGNRISLRKRDATNFTFNYDAMNRLIQKRVPDPAGGPNATATGNCYALASDSNDICYGYDSASGLQLAARFGSASGLGVTSTYNGYGWLTSSSTNMSGTARTLNYGYDPLTGLRTSLTFPDGQVFNYGYDKPVKRMHSISEGSTIQIATFHYNPHGRRDGLTGGVTSTWGYDEVDRLISINHDLAGTTYDINFGIGGYSPANQIMSRTRSNDAYAWTGYVNVSRSYSTNGLNQYLTAGSASFGYDANGNLTSDGTTTYAYDRENRLIRATTGGATVNLSYDPNGRLLQTSGGNQGTTQFLYDGDALVAEYDVSGNVMRRYLHGSGIDEPLVWYEGSTVGSGNRRVLRADQQSSIISVADSIGSSLAINSYDEHGIPVTANLGRFSYTGQIYLPEIGVYYYKARFYSPTLGRFLQVDPVGYKDQMGLYAYVSNDPINSNDPSGLYKCVTTQACDAAVTGISQLRRAKDFYSSPEIGSRLARAPGAASAIGKELDALGKKDGKGVTIEVADLGGDKMGHFGPASNKGGDTIQLDLNKIADRHSTVGEILGHETQHYLERGENLPEPWNEVRPLAMEYIVAQAPGGSLHGSPLSARTYVESRLIADYLKGIGDLGERIAKDSADAELSKPF